MTNTTLTLLAAGSLRSAFLPLVAHFRQHTGLAVDAQFGPAGLLRERIEAGSPCAWLIRQNLADLFIGYAHYGPALAACDDLRTLTIPAPWNIRCDYQLARLRADPAALALYRFILGDVGQGYLRQAGFMPFSDAA